MICSVLQFFGVQFSPIGSLSPSIINHTSSIQWLIQKRIDLGFDLLIGKRIDGERMLIAGGRTHSAPLARHIDDMYLSPLLGMLDFKGAVWTKGHTEPASPARIFVGQY